jgi:hypothetical protein
MKTKEELDIEFSRLSEEICKSIKGSFYLMDK